MGLWQAILDVGEAIGIKVTGPILSRAVERGVTDSGYYNNSNMNPLEDLSAKRVDVNKSADYIGKVALQEIVRQGVKRQSICLLINDEVPRLEWFWDVTDTRGNPGQVGWANYSFQLQQYIGIAVVDKDVEVGEFLTIEP